MYEYGDDEVIKFDRADFLVGRNAEHREFHDHAICKEFFGEYILDTKLVHSPNGKRLVEIQPRVTGHYLGVVDMKEPQIAAQFKNIVEAYRKLKEAGYPEIDLMGQGGAFSRCLSNIFVLPDGSLRIIDASLLDDGYVDSWIGKSVIRWLRRRVVKHQTKTIAMLLTAI